MHLGRIPYFAFLVLALVSTGLTGPGIIGTDILAFILFVLALAALIYKDRKKVKLEGIVIIRRTQRGRDAIDRVAQRHRGFWGRWATLGLVIAIPLMFIGAAFLVVQAGTVLQGSGEGGVRLLLPGPVSEPVNAPGVFVVPWWIWVIGIAAVIIPHELMHGVVCRLDKIPIKSVGWILLIIIPGAFVEPDEARLKKARRSTRMKVYAAGSFANLAAAVAIALVFMLTFPLFFSPAGLLVRTTEGGPANASGLQGSILSIDGAPVSSMDALVAALAGRRPGEAVTVTAAADAILVPHFSGPDFIIPKPVAASALQNVTSYTIVLAEHPDKAGTAYLGVQPAMQTYRYDGDLGAYQAVSVVMLWIFIFSFGIGLVNLLPIKPLDGGLLFEDMVGHFTPRTKMIVRTVSVVMVFLILFNLLGPVLLG